MFFVGLMNANNDAFRTVAVAANSFAQAYAVAASQNRGFVPVKAMPLT